MTEAAVFIGWAVTVGDVALRGVMERLPMVILTAEAGVEALLDTAALVPEAMASPDERVVLQGLCLAEEDDLTLIVSFPSFLLSLPRLVT